MLEKMFLKPLPLLLSKVVKVGAKHTKGFCPPVCRALRAQVWSQAIALHHDFGARITPRF